MKRYYLVTNTRRDEPAEIKQATGYVHVKGHVSGDWTLALTVGWEVSRQDCVEKSFDEAQVVLDEWIAAENEGLPLTVEKDGEIVSNPELQRRIDLARF